MVLIWVANSEIGAHVRSYTCYLICFRHLIDRDQSQNFKSFKSSELQSNTSTMFCDNANRNRSALKILIRIKLSPRPGPVIHNKFFCQKMCVLSSARQFFCYNIVIFQNCVWVFFMDLIRCCRIRSVFFLEVLIRLFWRVSHPVFGGPYPEHDPVNLKQDPATVCPRSLVHFNINNSLYKIGQNFLNVLCLRWLPRTGCARWHSCRLNCYCNPPWWPIDPMIIIVPILDFGQVGESVVYIYIHILHINIPGWGWGEGGGGKGCQICRWGDTESRDLQTLR